MTASGRGATPDSAGANRRDHPFAPQGALAMPARLRMAARTPNKDFAEMTTGQVPTRHCIAVATAVLLTLTACSGEGQVSGGLRASEARSAATDTEDLPDSLTDQDPDWSECEPPDDAPDAAETTGGLPEGIHWECATMEAPVDYADPEGDTLDLAMIRARTSANEDDRIGSLLFNFGGPGGSGVVTLPAFSSEYRALHQGGYDLISFDPRGVGDSEGVVCLDDAELDDYFAADLAPRNDTEEAELLERTEEFASACEERNGELLTHFTTTDTARDLDLMRAVLGDDRLHYFGVSYGTELGGVYAHLFPERLGRAVFDAVVDPTKDSAQSALGQAKGFQLALENYLDSCVQSENCPLGDDPATGQQRLNDLLDRLRSEPAPTDDPDGRNLTQALAWGGIAQALYSEDFWPYLTQGLDDVLDSEDPDGSLLLVLGDAMNGRSEDGSYSSLQSSLTAINCADSSERYSPGQVRERLPEFERVSPVFGTAMAWGLLGCAGWPVEGESAHPDVGASDVSDSILLIGTTGDPATPYEGTQRMKEALGKGAAVELTYEGEGHGAYHSGDRCVKSATDDFLLRGDLPPDGTTCG